MGRDDRPYVFNTHTCYHRHGPDHPDFCWRPGRYRRRVTSKRRRAESRRIARIANGRLP